MPALVAGGMTVPVALDGASEEAELIGDRDRMFDGAMREVSDGYKRRWPFTTRALSPEDFAALRAILVGAPPIECSGDLLGETLDCFVELGAVTPGKVAGGIRRVLRFTLLEA